MRRITAIVVVATLVFAGTDAVRAAAGGDAPKPRNPIEWLLSDIGKLLSGAAARISRTAEATTTPAPEKSTDAASAEASAEPVPAQATVPSSGNEQHPQPAQAAETGTFRNPIAWFFSDLARIFQPDLEIEQSPPATAAAKPAAGTASVSEADAATAETSDSKSPDSAGETAAAPDTAGETAAGGSPSNPIAWLFRDLARLFAPATNDPALATAELAAPQETPAKPVSLEPGDPEPAPKEPARDTQHAEPPIAHTPATAETIEIAPWVPHPARDPFDPNDSLFASNGTPLLPAPAPAAAPKTAPAPVQTAEVTEAAEQAEIRKRAPYRPERRNRIALGHEHKAVTPDPDDGSIVDRVLESLFGIDEPVDAGETVANKVPDRIVPEENLDLGYTSPDAHIPDRKLTRLEDGPLTGLDLYMGKDSVIGAPYAAAAIKENSCVERALHGSVFCLKSLNWPAAIAPSFAADTAFLLPGEGVVRYENGVASRVYAVFKAQDFADVVKFMQQRFGPPQEREIGWMHMLEAPKLPNTTFRWQALGADRRDAIVLEVRNYDDLRRSFADMDHGMVRLYRAGSRPIFKHISTMDLMLLQRRRVAHAPVEVNTPPKQQ